VMRGHVYTFLMRHKFEACALIFLALGLYFPCIRELPVRLRSVPNAAWASSPWRVGQVGLRGPKPPQGETVFRCISRDHRRLLSSAWRGPNGSHPPRLILISGTRSALYQGTIGA
jgi:hypothetical protein